MLDISLNNADNYGVVMKITYAGWKITYAGWAVGGGRDADVDVNAQLPWKNECAVCAGMSYID